MSITHSAVLAMVGDGGQVIRLDSRVLLYVCFYNKVVNHDVCNTITINRCDPIEQTNNSQLICKERSVFNVHVHPQ